MYNNEWLNIYLITNDCDKFDTHTHAGSVSDLKKRFQQHNGKIPGGPQDTKRAAGYWKLVFFMRIPPIRNFSCRELVKWFNQFRGLTSRCKEMFLFALDTVTEFMVSRHVVDSDHENYCEEVDLLLKRKFSTSQIERMIVPDNWLYIE